MMISVIWLWWMIHTNMHIHFLHWITRIIVLFVIIISVISLRWWMVRTNMHIHFLHWITRIIVLFVIIISVISLRWWMVRTNMHIHFLHWITRIIVLFVIIISVISLRWWMVRTNMHIYFLHCTTIVAPVLVQITAWRQTRIKQFSEQELPVRKQHTPVAYLFWVRSPCLGEQVYGKGFLMYNETNVWSPQDR